MEIFRKSPMARRLALGILCVLFVIAATILVAYQAIVPSDGVVLAVGQVAPADILAPRSITYESQVLTQLARQAAADSIRAIYDPPDPSVLRRQIQISRHLLDFIDNIRHDTFADRPQQIADLNQINVVAVDETVYRGLLELSDDDWKNIDSQVMVILERAMRNEIREETLNEVYANLPNLVSVNVLEAQANLIVALVKDLIKANTFYNEERTREARQLASDNAPPETRSFVQGQIVVRAGSIVTEADMEALTQLKLLQPPDRRIQVITGSMLAVTLISVLGISYMRRFHYSLYYDIPKMLLLGCLFLLFLAGGRVFDASDIFQSHLYPAAAFGLIIVALADAQVAIALMGGLAVLIGLVSGNSLEFSMLVATSGIAGVLTLRRVERLNAYFKAGLMIALATICIGLLFLLIQGTIEPVNILTIIVSGMINGALSAGLGIVGLYFVSSILNLPTSVRLLELSQPSQTLVQRLLREAPGTYQHSLQVANLAELAAERIGANAPLMRVAALYHDIGKMSAPHYFVENQADGINPHDTLNDPVRSAKIIIGHVIEGEKLARKYRLPRIMMDFILQHHGTMQVLYFYNKAIEAAGLDESKVDKKLFTYPGPKPQSRESGVLMLADMSESIIRAKRPRNKQEIEEIVRDIVSSRMADGQLDESGLTINDLKIIREVFVSTLQGVFHPRIAYPPNPITTQEMKAVPASPAETTLGSGEVSS